MLGHLAAPHLTHKDKTRGDGIVVPKVILKPETLIDTIDMSRSVLIIMACHVLL